MTTTSEQWRGWRTTGPASPPTVRAARGAQAAFAFHILYGAFGWARRALNGPKRRYPARAVVAEMESTVSAAKYCLAAEARLGLGRIVALSHCTYVLLLIDFIP